MQFRTASELDSWLMDQVNDGGSKALGAVSDLVGSERDLEIKGPAMAALLCWGEAGCEAIRAIALSAPTSKNVSGAMKLLSAASSGLPFNPSLSFLHSDRLANAINRALANGRLQQTARENLLDLLQSLSTDDILIPVGVAFTQLAIADTREQVAASELIRAMSSRWLKLGPSVLKSYMDLIRSHPGDETAFQKFFCEHPQLLDPMAIQVWSQPDLHGAKEPDFLIRRSDNTYLIVEIETPDKMLVTQSGQLSERATNAERQTVEYRQFLDERISEARRHFPDYGNAECLAVVGMESSLTDRQAASLKAANAVRHLVRIVGFDWLAARANSIVKNVSSGGVEVITNHRLV